ncbi:alpha/beta fold hydrolase [Streptomyces roseicoloratus]|uniref:alpha/beta fold hydrolase n=1 Tax=Streptomyces roseicoloratus TaxID=2508722 RepID=UPI001009D34D|nr:alpha/beta fold hydrolase [Streptomyces roseicoloratus]
MRMELSDVTLDVEVAGEGPAVLLVHGFPDSHRLWRHQIAALNAAGYRTIAPTLRGFGASDRPEGGVAAYHPAKHVGDMLELLSRLDVDRCHVVGHDWGSGVAQGLAQFAAERVASLTLMSVGDSSVLLGPDSWQERQRMWHMTMFQFAGLAEEWLSRDDFANLRQMLAGHADRDEVLEPLRAPGALTASLNIYRAALPMEVQLGEPPARPPFAMPVMGVWSTGDPYLTERQMTALAPRVPERWRYERVEDAGHWLQLDQPERVNELLLSFLKENG